jgi:hypothetical protein
VQTEKLGFEKRNETEKTEKIRKRNETKKNQGPRHDTKKIIIVFEKETKQNETKRSN